jgi:hypothetical protein
MIDASNVKLTEEEFKDRLAKMLKNGDIKFKDVPKNIRDDVAKLAYGRYPMKDFASLEVIKK